ncbi:hypothetical protein LHK12_02155 [Providencia rettgeri]|nr:hypothetical protein [Providencia rettgeri]
MTNAQWVIQALNAVLGENIGSLPVAKQYFSDKYIQIVDGKQIDFNEFITHLQVLKEATESIVITIKSIAEGMDVFILNIWQKPLKKMVQ